MADGDDRRGQEGHRLRSPNGRVWLAGRYAGLSSNGQWPVRSAELYQERHRPRAVLHSRRQNGSSAWFCEEVAEDTTRGSRTGDQTQTGDRAMSKENIGSTLESFLKEEGIYEYATSHAIKRVIAW